LPQSQAKTVLLQVAAPSRQPGANGFAPKELRTMYYAGLLRLAAKGLGRLALLSALVAFIASGPVEAAVSQEGFKAFIAAFRAKAIEGGVKPEAYDSATAGLTANFSLPDLDIPEMAGKQPGQPEFVRTPEQYLNPKYLVDLAAQGRKFYAAHQSTIDAIEAKYGIDRYVVLAIWGRETAFGTSNDSTHNALQVLATLSYAGTRKELFQKNFIYAIRMVQDGVIAAKEMKSSWAGAMGLAQFMPEDYYLFAVDFDGDGKKDIWRSVPDALASLANNLAQLGWDKTQPWGFEVRAAASVDCSLGYLDVRKTVREWAAMGIAPLKGDAFPDGMLDWQGSLLQPAGAFGPAFLTLKNFQTIREYNRSDLYALFVSDLSDRIRGAGGFERKWDPAQQIPTADVEYMQKRLAALGLYRDTVDGKAGGRTRSAAGAYQKREGLPQTCWPTPALIAHLKEHEAKETSAGGGK
jgi:lytic murein transglycosylase